MPPATTATTTLELHYTDDGRVKVVPHDSDLMVLSINTAVAACCAYTEQIRFGDQFNHLLSYLGTWIEKYRSGIASAHLTSRDSGLLLLIEQDAVPYDAKLNDALTDLDLAVANDADFNLIQLDVLALPRTDLHGLESFLSPQMKLQPGLFTRFVFDDVGGRRLDASSAVAAVSA